MDGKPATGMADMKQMMKEQLLQVKLYGEAPGRNGGLESRKSMKCREPEKLTLGALEKEYDLVRFGGQTAAASPSTPQMKGARKSGLADRKLGGTLKAPTPATGLRPPTTCTSANNGSVSERSHHKPSPSAK